MKTLFCYWAEVEKKGGDRSCIIQEEPGGEWREGGGESGQSSICRQCPVSQEKKLDFIVGFIHHQYMTPSNLHTVRVERLCAWNSFWDQ